MKCFSAFLSHFFRLSLFAISAAPRAVGIFYFLCVAICALKVIAWTKELTMCTTERVWGQSVFRLHSEAMSNDSKLCCFVAFFSASTEQHQKMNLTRKKGTHQMKCIRLTMKRPPLAFLHESTRVVGSCIGIRHGRTESRSTWKRRSRRRRKKMVTWKIINARAVSDNNGDDDEGEKKKFRKIVEEVIKQWNPFGNAAVNSVRLGRTLHYRRRTEKLKEMKQIINHNRNDIVRVGRMCVSLVSWLSPAAHESFVRKHRQMYVCRKRTRRPNSFRRKEITKTRKRKLRSHLAIVSWSGWSGHGLGEDGTHLANHI